MVESVPAREAPVTRKSIADPLDDEDLRLLRVVAFELRRSTTMRYLPDGQRERFLANNVLTWTISRGTQHRAWFITQEGLALLAQTEKKL
jgi:hypothetical protein